jgi:hypothetical protein
LRSSDRVGRQAGRGVGGASVRVFVDGTPVGNVAP